MFLLRRFQGNCFPLCSVLCSSYPLPGQGMQCWAHGALYLWWLSGPGEPQGLAVGGVWGQSQIQHQIPQKLPRPEEDWQRPAGQGRHPQHQRGNQGELAQNRAGSDASILNHPQSHPWWEWVVHCSLLQNCLLCVIGPIPLTTSRIFSFSSGGRSLHFQRRQDVFYTHYFCHILSDHIVLSDCFSPSIVLCNDYVPLGSFWLLSIARHASA